MKIRGLVLVLAIGHVYMYMYMMSLGVILVLRLAASRLKAFHSFIHIYHVHCFKY